MADFGTPYWWEDGAPLPDLPETPPQKTELAVIGAGYTGLSAAITARRAGAEVTVLDAAIPGQGASTRNGGMFGAHTRISIDAMSKSFGRAAAVAILNEAPQAYAFTRGFIQAENIQCDFQQTGRIVLASGSTAQATQVRLATSLKKLTGYELGIVAPAEVKDHINTDIYAGGIFYEDHGGLQPRKLHDGLLEIALREGVNIIQNCAVLDVGGREGAFILKTAKGDLQADKLIHATNGYTRKPFRWLERRVFPLPSFIIATEPLPPEQIARLAPGRRMMVETRAKHSYYRISPDGTRIVFGGRAGMVPLGPKLAAKRLKATMVGIWPELKDVKITHSWRGYTGFTFEQMPHVGQFEGRHFAMGYSGSGVAMAPYLGMKVAYQALGDKRGETAYSLTTPSTRLYHHGGYPLFLAAGEVWYRQVVDRLEARRAKE
ncbi:MAG: glycine/D-amino acid oxidase-like deaminating enzyme [Paracoccaceae bacterium]|jgi:glycine/D-amino acid oxidase-like deaminating enzyme